MLIARHTADTSKPDGARRRLTEATLMANGSLRRQACNQSGPAGSFLDQEPWSPNATAGHQISKLVRAKPIEGAARPRRGLATSARALPPRGGG